MATVRARRLGRDLRRYREGANLTINAAAERLGWDRTKIGRLEGAKVTKPKPAEIEELLDLYGVTSPERDELLQLAADARRRGWWTAFGDVFDGTYPGLEDEAARIFSWRSQLVPGLLQTEAYAWAVLTASYQTAGKDAIHTRVQARMARKPLLSRPDDAPRFHTVLDEAVLRREIGGPDVMRAQIQDLCMAAQRPNITIQVLPFGAGAHPGVDGSFVILSFPGDVDPDVVFIEGLQGDIYPESEQAINRFRLAAERLTEAALSPEKSANLLADLIKEVE